MEYFDPVHVIKGLQLMLQPEHYICPLLSSLIYVYFQKEHKNINLIDGSPVCEFTGQLNLMKYDITM